MEDADPTLTRKRQRLDDHVTPSRSRSLDPIVLSTTNMTEPEGPPSSSTMASSSPTSSPPVGVQPTVAQEQPHTPSTMSPDQGPSHVRTPSKVTINVRARPSDPVDEASHGSPGSQDAVVPTSPHDSTHSSSPHSSPTANRTSHERSEQGETTTAKTNDAPATRASSTTSVRSPEIEVAEVEDMDQDDTAEDWDPLVTVVQPDVRDALIEKFPVYSQGCDLKQLITHVAAIMEKGGWILRSIRFPDMERQADVDA